jgi:hypothetical protein
MVRVKGLAGGFAPLPLARLAARFRLAPGGVPLAPRFPGAPPAGSSPVPREYSCPLGAIRTQGTAGAPSRD